MPKWYEHYGDIYIRCLACKKGYIYESVKQFERCPGCNAKSRRRPPEVPDEEPGRCKLCRTEPIVEEVAKGPWTGWWQVRCPKCGWMGPNHASLQPSRKKAIHMWIETSKFIRG